MLRPRRRSRRSCTRRGWKVAAAACSPPAAPGRPCGPTPPWKRCRPPQCRACAAWCRGWWRKRSSAVAGPALPASLFSWASRGIPSPAVAPTAPRRSIGPAPTHRLCPRFPGPVRMRTTGCTECAPRSPQWPCTSVSRRSASPWTSRWGRTAGFPPARPRCGRRSSRGSSRCRSSPTAPVRPRAIAAPPSPLPSAPPLPAPAPACSCIRVGCPRRRLGPSGRSCPCARTSSSSRWSWKSTPRWPARLSSPPSPRPSGPLSPSRQCPSAVPWCSTRCSAALCAWFRSSSSCTFSRLGKSRTSSFLLSAYRKRSSSCRFSRLGKSRTSSSQLSAYRKRLSSVSSRQR